MYIERDMSFIPKDFKDKKGISMNTVNKRNPNFPVL